MGHHPVSDLFIVVGERGLGQTNVRVQDPIWIREPSRVCDGLPPGLGRPIIGASFGEMLCNLPTDRCGGLIGPEALEARLPQNTLLCPFSKSYFRHELWLHPVRALRVVPRRRVPEPRFPPLEGAELPMECLQQAVGESCADSSRIAQRPVFVK